MDTPHWFVQIFGSLSITDGAKPVRFRTKKTASLVALLSLRPGREFQRESLIGQFWPESEPLAARQSLRMALSDIRTNLGDSVLRSDGDWVSLSKDEVGSSTALMLDLIAQSRKDRTQERDLLSRAVDLVAGPPCSSLVGDWITAEWFQSQEIYASAVIRLLEVCAEDSQFQTGVAVAKRALQVLGCREDIHISLMKLYMAQGTPSLALAQLEDLERQLDDLWGEPPSEEAYAVIDSQPRARAGRADTPAVSSGLIGREELLEEILKRLQEHRLVTLVGPGGVGKTTLAAEVAERLGRRFAFVDLTSETEARGAARQILTALELPFVEQGEAASVISAELEQRNQLLILDNLEQLVEAGAPFIANLVSKMDTSRILGTSRVALQVEQESVIDVPPLAQPADVASLDQMRTAPAVALFEREGMRANPRFRVTPANISSVVELCRKLDGLPLAIELAAAAVTVQSPAQILANLNDSILSLDRKTPRQSRHDSLSQTISRSLGLLTPQTQEVCIALGAIQGRFDVETAAITSGVAQPERFLEAMMMANLLNADPSGETAQFWMFETIKSFMRDEMERRGLTASVMRRFHDGQMAMAEEIGHKLKMTSDQRYRRFHTNRENFISAIRYGVDSMCNPVGTAQMLVELREIGLNEVTIVAEEQSDKILQWEEGVISDQLWAKVCVTWAAALANRADPELLSSRLNEALKRAEGDNPTCCDIHYRLGTICKATGDLEEATGHYTWVLEHLEAANHAYRSRVLHSLGLVQYFSDPVATLATHLEALRESRLGDDVRTRIWILFDAGSELAAQGRGEEALSLFDEAEELSSVLGSRKMQGLTKWQLGDAYLSMSKPQEALQALKESIRLVMIADFEAGLKWIFVKTAEALGKCAQPKLATRCLGKVFHERTSTGRPLAGKEEEDFNRICDLMKDSLGAAQFERHWTEGQAESWQTLIDQTQAIG